MSDKRGKYYWVRTEVGREIAFKRDSGAWEMHGIDCTEDLRELILEVYEEVANEDSKQAEKALAIQDVSSSAYKDELIRKTESMIWFARENYNKEYYEGVLNAMRNLQVHIKKIYKKHYC